MVQMRVNLLRVFLFVFSILAAANALLVPSKTTVTITATPTPTPPTSQCNTGPIQCCNSVQPASSGGLVSTLLSLLGIVLEDLNVDVGLTCSPISAIGLSSGGCNASPVCCSNNNFSGLIAIGCVPINISL